MRCHNSSLPIIRRAAKKAQRDDPFYGRRLKLEKYHLTFNTKISLPRKYTFGTKRFIMVMKYIQMDKIYYAGGIRKAPSFIAWHSFHGGHMIYD